MVCSSLLGCGIDVEGVSTVYHFKTPWSILDFAQESGRAGRGGKPSTSVVFAAIDEREPDVEDDGGLYGKQTMREWVLQSSVCRRIALSSFLDNGRTTCSLLKGAVHCDVCAAESMKEHPGLLVPFSTSMVPTGDTGSRVVLPTVPPSSLDYATKSNAPGGSTRFDFFTFPVGLADGTRPRSEQSPGFNNEPTTSNDRIRKRGEEPRLVRFSANRF